MDKYCPKCFKNFAKGLAVCPEDGAHLVSFADGDLVGQTLDDRYRVVGRIGAGGMGVVYKAEQPMIRRTVALKVLNKDIIKDDTSLKRFLNEARAMASLKSAHTVTLYDFGSTSTGLIYYTMELLDGEPLSKLIRRDAPLAIERAADLMCQACLSLEEAHDGNILHRDIKPDNLFVLRGGKLKGEHLKVLDFGIAKLVGDTSIGTVTKTGMICGTPAYLSPEAVLGHEVGPPSDLYALGIVFYEMLAGKPPFAATTAMQLLMQHVNDPPKPVTEANSTVVVPLAVERFVQKALAKKPSDRFQTAAEFASALREAVVSGLAQPTPARLPSLSADLAGTRTLASPTLTSPGTPQSDARGRLPDAAATAPESLSFPAHGATQALAVDSQAAPPAATPTPMAPVDPRPGRRWVPVAAAAAAVLVAVALLLLWARWKQSTPAQQTSSQSLLAAGNAAAGGAAAGGAAAGNAVAGNAAAGNAAAGNAAAGNAASGTAAAASVAAGKDAADKAAAEKAATEKAAAEKAAAEKAAAEKAAAEKAAAEKAAAEKAAADKAAQMEVAATAAGASQVTGKALVALGSRIKTCKQKLDASAPGWKDLPDIAAAGEEARLSVMTLQEQRQAALESLLAGDLEGAAAAAASLESGVSGLEEEIAALGATAALQAAVKAQQEQARAAERKELASKVKKCAGSVASAVERLKLAKRNCRHIPGTEAKADALLAEGSSLDAKQAAAADALGKDAVGAGVKEVESFCGAAAAFAKSANAIPTLCPLQGDDGTKTDSRLKPLGDSI